MLEEISWRFFVFKKICNIVLWRTFVLISDTAFDGWLNIILSHIVSFPQHWLWSPRPRSFSYFLEVTAVSFHLLCLYSLNRLSEITGGNDFPPSHCFLMTFIFLFVEASKVPEYDERCLETCGVDFVLDIQCSRETWKMSFNLHLTSTFHPEHELRCRHLDDNGINKWHIVFDDKQSPT